MDSPTESPAREPALNFHKLFGPAERVGSIVCILLIAAFLAEMFTGGPGRWGLSARALAQGRYETILTHMFAHAGWLHLIMNMGALFSFSARLTPHLGLGVGGAGRYGVLLVLCGLSGALVFLAVHPAGSIPMVGISGAICGLWGAAIRLPAIPGWPLAPLLSRHVMAGARQFVVTNAVLFAIIFVLVFMAGGGGGGLAWEAHLGGFLLGLFSIPLFVRQAPPRAADLDHPSL